MEIFKKENIILLGVEGHIGLLNAVEGKDILSRGNNISDDHANKEVLSAYKFWVHITQQVI